MSGMVSVTDGELGAGPRLQNKLQNLFEVEDLDLLCPRR
jgi:hypothetical protein